MLDPLYDAPTTGAGTPSAPTDHGNATLREILIGVRDHTAALTSAIDELLALSLDPAARAAGESPTQVDEASGPDGHDGADRETPDAPPAATVRQSRGIGSLIRPALRPH